MNIYDYINSSDVAAHCREIGKVWLPFEMAVIIGRSHCLLAEKHAAWRELIFDYPDMPTPDNIHYNSFQSLHKILADIIEYQERLLMLFKTPETGAVFKHSVLRHKEHCDSNCVFSAYEKTLADAHELWERDEAPIVKYEKVFIDYERRMELYTDYDGNPSSIYVTGPGWDTIFLDMPDTQMFEDMFFVDIPMPFKRGDVLSFHGVRHDEGHVFVLDSLVQDDKELYQKRLGGKMSDGTDLMGWGFFVSDDGVLYGDHAGYQDCYEYYRGEFKGNRRLLHYVSLYLKDEIQLPELLSMQCRIAMEHLISSSF